MHRLTKSFAVITLAVVLSASSVNARPNRDDQGPGAGFGSRIVRLIKQLIRVVHDDPSVPKP